MFDWVDDAVSGAKKVWDDMTAGDQGAKQSGSSKGGGSQSQGNTATAEDLIGLSGTGNLNTGKVGGTIEGATKSGGGSSSGSKSWWDHIWGGGEEKDDSPVHVPMKTEEPPEPDKDEESWWERERKRKEAHNKKVSTWKAYARERRVLMDKLSELESRRGFLQRNPYNWAGDYVLEQQIQVDRDEDAVRAELSGLKEPPFDRPEPYDYYVI